MARRLVDLTLDNLHRLPARCRSCVFWELDPVTGRRRAGDGEGDVAKQAWLSLVLLEWGSCGKLVLVDDEVAGYVTYAPPGYVPRAVAFPTSPVSADAVLLMTAHVVPPFGGAGLGRLLMQTVAKDLTRRGVQAIEAFGDVAGSTGAVSCLPTTCGRSASARSGRTSGFPACGSISGARCRGARTSVPCWNDCWGRCSRTRCPAPRVTRAGRPSQVNCGSRSLPVGASFSGGR